MTSTGATEAPCGGRAGPLLALAGGTEASV